MGAVKPTILKTTELNLDTATLLNSVRAVSSTKYQNAVPMINRNDLAGVQLVGSIWDVNPDIANEAINTLINRIGRVYIITRTYMHNLGDIKKGEMPFGESIESIYVGIINAIVYDVEDAENTVFKRYKTPVYSVVNYLNSQVDYPITIEELTLRKAFLTYDGLSDLISGLIMSAYNSAQYDEFISIKYLLQSAYIKGVMLKRSIPELTSKENIEQMLIQIKADSNNMTFYSAGYNAYGATTFSPKDDQLFITDSVTNAGTDVTVLAQTFNLDYARYMGIQKMIDSFGTNDNARLSILFAKDPNYYELTQDDYNQLSKVHAMLIDRNFLMIVDNLFRLENIYNPKGLYNTNFLHKWTIYGVVPFAQAIAYTTEQSTVTSVSISPNTISVARGQTQQFEATVLGTGNPSKLVQWEVTGTGDSTISDNGLLTVSPDESETTLTVKATSFADSAVSGNATVTIT